MFNLINSQVYELQQQESLLLFEKQQQQHQQQIQLQQYNSQKNKSNNKKNGNLNNNNNNNNSSNNTTIVTNIDTNLNNNGALNNNCKSLNNLTNYLNNNNNNSNSKNNSDTINRKKKSNYGSYYRQEKLKATANFIEKFLKSETTSSIVTASKEQQQRQHRQQQQQHQQQQQQINDENKHICYTPSINFTYTYQTLDEYPGDKNNIITKNNCNNKMENCNNNNNNNNCNDHYTINDRLKFNNYNNNKIDNNNSDGIFREINEDNNRIMEKFEDDDNNSDNIELGSNSLQLEHLNNLLDKNSSDTMPSLSPSQSSTDQSTSTQTTTATISSNNNSLSSNGSSAGGVGGKPEIKIKRILKKSSCDVDDDQTIITTTTTTTDRINQKSNNNSLNSVLHRKKLLQVVSFLDQQNQRLEKELQNEKVQRNEELSRIVKSLLYFEAKLKSEKKVINQKLYEKDDEIARLVRLNRSLKEKLNENETARGDAKEEETKEKEEGEEDDRLKEENQLNDQLECKYPESLYCSNCRKEYYGLNEKCDNWTQTSGKITDCRSNLKGENNNNNNNEISNNSTEHCSSSDETLSSSFYGARRSVRYTSKRTFGTFREYMRSRCMNIDDTNIDNNNNLSEDEQRSTLSRDEYPSHSSSNYNSKSYNKKDKKTFSSKMERLHGVKRNSSFEFDSSEAEMRYYKKNISSSGPETDHEHTNSPNDEGIEEDDDENDYDEDDINDYNDNHLGNDIYRGVNVGVLTTIPTTTTTATSTITTVNSKEFSEISVKQDFETSTDDWYASASDADDDQNSNVCRTKSYGYNAVNPVLECVNQILLQQSMEECINEKMSTGSGSGNGSIGIRENHYDNSCNGPMSLESNDNINAGNFSICSGGSGSKENHTNSSTSNGSNSGGSRKRVHFSTKNSMVHVPRDDDDITDHKSCSFSDTINSSIASEHHSNNLNYESIYSNEYEPIGSENNSSNLYVDMESKLDPDERINSKSKHLQHNHHHQHQQHHQQHQQQSQNKQPPALPPKPANLIKFKRVNKSSTIQPSLSSHRHSIDSIPIQSAGSDSSEQTTTAKLTKELLEKIDCDKSEKYGSEPDYCSISEVNVAIKTMQIVAEVHKSNDTNSSSSASITSVLSGDNSDSMSQKTSDDTEEIFADIPKLPNVAAIIAPSKNKSPKCNKESSNNIDSNFLQSQTSLQLQQKQQLQQQFQQHQHQQQQQQQRPQSLQLYRPKSPGQVQRKHVPNILAEINKKIQQANTTSTTATITGVASLTSPTSPNKMNSNFIIPINHQTKRKTSSNQLLPILKSPSSSSSSNGNIGGGGCIINSKNFNNILLSTQTINNTPICKSLKNLDTIKLNHKQKNSPSIQQQNQQKFINQMQLNSINQKSYNKNNRQNQLLQHNQQHQHQLTKIEDSSLEAEFDWYNLDAEYGKSSTNRPDIVKAADVLNSCLDEYILTNSTRADRLANDINQSIEYNLDEEFSLSNQPDIIKENLRSSVIDDRKLETIPGSESESNESTSSSSKKLNDQYYTIENNHSDEQQSDDPETCSDENIDSNQESKELNLNIKKINDKNTLTVINKFPTICDQTPCRKSVNLKQKNFVEFIDNAGLSTKSLPQQKKIYFTGPFV